MSTSWPEFDEETEIPWPRAGDQVFASSDNRWMNARVNWGGGWDSYALGYKTAGDILVEHIEETGHHIDALVYPIVFNYRQYLELMLKDVLMEARRYFDLEPSLEKGHALLSLWHPLRELIERRWPDEPEELDAVQENLRQIDVVDRGSYAFRYATDPKGDPSLPGEMEYIDLQNLSEVVGRIGTFLEACATALSAEREASE